MKQTNHALETDLKQSEKRAFQHWYQDGLTETAVGFYFLLLGLLFYIEYAIEGSNISAMGLPLLTIGGIAILKPVVQRLKARFTYPRTGFVSFKEQSPNRKWLALGIGLAVGIAMGVLVGATAFGDFVADIRPSQEAATLIWLPLVQAAVFAIALIYMGYRFSLGRYYALAVVSLVAGGVVVVARLEDPLGTAVHFTILALALILSGLTTLRDFLRHTRPFTETD
jgi:hypothetical protein